METNDFMTDVIEDEALAGEAAEAAVPAKKEKKAKAPKAPKLDAEGNPVVKTPKEPKAPKDKAPTLKDKFLKGLVTMEESGLRVGTGRYQFLEAALGATKCGDIIGKTFVVDGKEVTLQGNNVLGMFGRGHIALSTDGEKWERLVTTVVAE